MDWSSLQFFLALARHGSLDRAAQELRVDPSTVSRKVRALEAEIRARVFDRTATGHRPTPVGRLMLRTAEQVESSIAAMERIAECADERLEGVIRIATPHQIARQLSRWLADFRLRHSLVTFEITANAGAASLIRHDVDLAIWLSRPEQAQLASRRMTTLGFGLYGSAGYLDSHPLHDLDGPKGHLLLGYEERLSHLPEAQWLARWAKSDLFTLRANCVDVLLSAAVSGLGLAVLPCYLADAEPRLVRILGPERVVMRDVWLVVHRDLRRIARVRALVDHLAGEGRAHDAEFQGSLRAAG